MSSNSNKVQKLSEEQGLHDAASAHLDVLIALDDLLSQQDAAFEVEQKALLDKYLTKKYEKMDERNAIAARCPSFWATVFESHPVIRTVIEDKDMDAFRYLTELLVERGPKQRKFIFRFPENPYFTNSELVKEIHESDDEWSVVNTPIHWKQGKSLIDENDGASTSFFSWFNDEDIEVADLLSNDFYPNASKYYLEGIMENKAPTSEEEYEELSDDDEENEEQEDEEAENDSLEEDDEEDDE